MGTGDVILHCAVHDLISLKMSGVLARGVALWPSPPRVPTAPYPFATMAADVSTARSRVAPSSTSSSGNVYELDQSRCRTMPFLRVGITTPGKHAVHITPCPSCDCAIRVDGNRLGALQVFRGHSVYMCPTQHVHAQLPRGSSAFEQYMASYCSLRAVQEPAPLSSIEPHTACHAPR